MNYKLLMLALKIMWQGMGTLFIVMFIISIMVFLLSCFSKKV